MLVARCRLWRSCFFCLAIPGLFAGALRGQALIDPSLPAAPLPPTSFFSLFPGDEVVEDSAQPVPPLKSQQKFEMAWRGAFAPALPVDAFSVSAFDQATHVGPDYTQGWDGFSERVGYNAANFATKSFFAFGIVPTAFHQDPRYFRMGSGATSKRILWVLRSQVIAFSDRGTEMPNYGKLLGFAASTAVSNLYMPRNSVSVGNDMKAYGVTFAVSVGVGLIREFDLTRLVHIPHRPPR